MIIYVYFYGKYYYFSKKIILSTKILHFFLHNLNFALKRAKVSWRLMSLTSHLCKFCFVYVKVLVICRFCTVKNEFQSLQMVCSSSVYKYISKNTEQTIRFMGSVSQVRMKPECLAKKFEPTR